MSYPVPFPLHYCLHQTSVFPDRGQHFYIRLLILPTHLLYSSHPHLKSVQLIHYFLFHCPRFATIQRYRPHHCPDHPFLQILLQTFRQNSFELLKATFAIAILVFTSSTQVPFSVITAPRYLNVVTSSTR